MAKITVAQKINGSDSVRFSAEITDAPENYADLLNMAADNEVMQQEIMLAVSEHARNRTLARLRSLDRAGEPLFKAIDFTYVITEPLRKLTAASMCSRLEAQLLTLGEKLQEAVEHGEFEIATEVAAEQKNVRLQLENWQAKREEEKAKKAASRAANAND